MNDEQNTAPAQEFQVASKPLYPSIRWQEALEGKETEENSIFPGYNNADPKQPCLKGVIYAEKKEDIGVNKSVIYIVQSIATGKKYGIWGSKALDDRMSIVPIGAELRMTFLGFKKGSGPKPWKDILVEYAKPVTSFVAAEKPSTPTDDVPFGDNPHGTIDGEKL